MATTDPATLALAAQGWTRDDDGYRHGRVFLYRSLDEWAFEIDGSFVAKGFITPNEAMAASAAVLSGVAR